MKIHILVAVACLFVANVRATDSELTVEQRRVADAVVGERIRTIQDWIVKDANLSENIGRLAKRQRDERSCEPAVRIRFCVQRCQDQHVPPPHTIDTQVVENIIWQYHNAYGEGNDQKSYREACAHALGVIGNAEGIPIILTSLARESGHYSWQALKGIADEKLLPAIAAHLDFACQQDAFPAITCLARIGTNAIPTLQRFLQGSDRALQRAAVDALIAIEAADCLPVLNGLTNSTDDQIALKARCGIQRIQCRAVDRIYSPVRWAPEDDARLWHLMCAVLFEDDKTMRSKASAAMLRIGMPVTGYLRDQLPNRSHADTSTGPVLTVSKDATALMVSLGSRAVPALIDALTDETQHARVFAAEALQKITGEAGGSDYDTWRGWYLKQRGTDK